MKNCFLILSYVFMSFAQAQMVTPNGTTLPQIIPQQNAADLQLTARVNEQIRSRVPSFRVENFNVFSQNGQVTIQGRVAQQSQADEILAAARTTPGITMVVNGIVVNPQY